MTIPPSDPRVQPGTGPFEREHVTGTSEARDPSIAALVGDLIGDAQALVRREVDLAKQEFSSEISKAQQGAIVIGGGLGVAAIGGVLLGHMLALLLQSVLNIPLWVTYLIAGGGFLIVAAILLLMGRKRLQRVDPVPRETIDSLRKDVQWIREQNPSDKI